MNKINYHNQRTGKQMLEFILANSPEAKKYDIEPIFRDAYAYASALGKILKVTFRGHSQYEVVNYYFESYQVNVNMPVETEAQRFKDWIASHGVTWDDYIFYYHHYALFKQEYFSRNGKLDTFTAHELRNPNLITLILELTGQKTDYNSLEQENNLLEEKGIDYKAIFSDLQIGNLTIKTYLNGRIDIKGLTAEQNAMIDKLLMLNEKFKKFH